MVKAKTLIVELRKEFFTHINASYQAISRHGYWTHHDAGRCFDVAAESLLERIRLGEFRKGRSFEEKALKSFKALVESEECRQFMEEYYGND